jgi:hypothetical protein
MGAFSLIELLQVLSNAIFVLVALRNGRQYERFSRCYVW